MLNSTWLKKLGLNGFRPFLTPSRWFFPGGWLASWGWLENPILMKTQSSVETWTWTLDFDLGFVNGLNYWEALLGLAKCLRLSFKKFWTMNELTLRVNLLLDYMETTLAHLQLTTKVSLKRTQKELIKYWYIFSFKKQPWITPNRSTFLITDRFFFEKKTCCTEAMLPQKFRKQINPIETQNKNVQVSMAELGHTQLYSLETGAILDLQVFLDPSSKT